MKKNDHTRNMINAMPTQRKKTNQTMIRIGSQSHFMRKVHSREKCESVINTYHKEKVNAINN